VDIVRRQQQTISQFNAPVVDLLQDAGGLMARRVVDQLIAEEQGGALPEDQSAAAE
jgi:hypothetical protein